MTTPVTDETRRIATNPVPQKRTGRRARIVPVIVIHTAESGVDLTGKDTKAEAVVNYITHRTNHGSYHRISDRDSRHRLVDFGDEAFHCRGRVNHWSIGIASAIDAEAWPELDHVDRAAYINNLADDCVDAIEYFEAAGLTYDNQLLARQDLGEWAGGRFVRTPAAENGEVSGLIGHGHIDYTRRTDPGVRFPWNDLLAAIDARRARPSFAEKVEQTRSVRSLQLAINIEAARYGTFDPVALDGAYGPKTAAALAAAITATQAKETP